MAKRDFSGRAKMVLVIGCRTSGSIRLSNKESKRAGPEALARYSRVYTLLHLRLTLIHTQSPQKHFAGDRGFLCLFLLYTIDG